MGQSMLGNDWLVGQGRRGVERDAVLRFSLRLWNACLDAFNVTRSKAGEGAFMLWTCVAGTDWSLHQRRDRSSHRGSPLAGSALCGYGGHLVDSFSGR